MPLRIGDLSYALSRLASSTTSSGHAERRDANGAVGHAVPRKRYVANRYLADRQVATTWHGPQPRHRHPALAILPTGATLNRRKITVKVGFAYACLVPLTFTGWPADTARP
jgi:hypothetical protein